MTDSKREHVSYLPTEGLSYDPAEDKYWDDKALAQEVERVFEVCHGCRMCFKYCDAFPNLFDAIDNKHDGDVRKLTAEETQGVMDDCFQCKLCEVQCPYTPRDGHEFQLDFPKLVHRYKAQRAKRAGRRLRERILGNPDGTAKLARASLGMANVMNRVSAHRWFMEKAMGLHRDKILPDFASQTFEAWARKEGRISQAPGGEAVLFQTCYVQNNEPQLGRDVVEVMERNQVDLRCEKGFACCGMPAWESGDLESLRKQAATNLKILEPYVDAGAKVLVINPTCSMMLRNEYPTLVAQQERDSAAKVAEAIMDPSEFLWSIRKEERFNTNFKTTPGERVSYHAPCHLRAQAKGFRGRDLLRRLGASDITMVAECCGHDGTFAMKVESFEASGRVGKKAFDQMKGGDAPVWSTDCPLAAIQFEQFAGVRPMHPMTILAKAYRGEPFGGQEEEPAGESS